jgi:hypothetical protein
VDNSPEDRVVSDATDALCDRFEDALRAGERPRIEDWVARLDPATDMVVCELCAIELDFRIRGGDSARAADYFARFPRLRADPVLAARLRDVELQADKARHPHSLRAIPETRPLSFGPKGDDEMTWRSFHHDDLDLAAALEHVDANVIAATTQEKVQ